LALTLTFASFTAHKYYISLIKVEYKKESKSVQITMRIFINDLQETINKTYTKDFELDEPDEDSNINKFIINYIQDNFIVKINSQNKSYQYLGKEYEKDVVFLYLEVKDIEAIQSIGIKNSMLMNIFPGQKNIIKLNINNNKKTFLLTKEKDKDLLKLN
ncbi:MAG TPA: hypothetical protein DDZ39_02210, partial [Flavobacteriaceae bacterium]|nr:hypothetical protein [Flavobacteriaceae bacterium]